MGVCPTPARHIAEPMMCTSRPCRRLPRTGLGATQTTTDPFRDWRSEVFSHILGADVPVWRSQARGTAVRDMNPPLHT